LGGGQYLSCEAFSDRRKWLDVVREEFAVWIAKGDATPQKGAGEEGYFSNDDSLLTNPTQEAAKRGSDILLLFMMRGEAAMLEEGVRRTLRPGDALILNPAEAGVPYADERRQELLAMRISRAKLGSALAKNICVGSTLLARDQPLPRLLFGYVRSYFESAQEKCDAGLDRLFCGHVRDLLALAFKPNAKAAKRTAVRKARAGQLQAILTEIAEHACESGFSAQVVADRLGLSDRYMRQLLETTAKTFSQHRLERRLDYAHLLLTDQASAHLGVTDVALMSGFSDVSHFNRSFRRRFGKTPSEARRSNGS
jgi:AraC-like DNA-binding protein